MFGAVHDRIYVANFDGTGERAITPLDHNSSFPAWSPDGKQLAYVADINETMTPTSVNVVNADGTDDHRVVARGGSPAWLADGRTLAYVASGGIFATDLGTGDVNRLTRPGETSFNDVGSPAGAHYLLASVISGGMGGIADVRVDYRLAADGTMVDGTVGEAVTETLATVVDDDPWTSVNDLTATFDWGDGTRTEGYVAQTAPGSYRVTGNHAYRFSQNYAARVTVQSADGATTTTTSHLNIFPRSDNPSPPSPPNPSPPNPPNPSPPNPPNPSPPSPPNPSPPTSPTDEPDHSPAQSPPTGRVGASRSTAGRGTPTTRGWSSMSSGHTGPSPYSSPTTAASRTQRA